MDFKKLILREGKSVKVFEDGGSILKDPTELEIFKMLAGSTYDGRKSNATGSLRCAIDFDDHLYIWSGRRSYTHQDFENEINDYQYDFYIYDESILKDLVIGGIWKLLTKTQLNWKVPYPVVSNTEGGSKHLCELLRKYIPSASFIFDWVRPTVYRIKDTRTYRLAVADNGEMPNKAEIRNLLGAVLEYNK